MSNTPARRFKAMLSMLVLALVGAGVWLTLRWSGSPRKVARPNVVLISLDTLRPDHLGCYGYDKDTSPNLDRFAKQSVVFTNCRAQAPWTLPSHMSLFTSMLPSSNGVDDIGKVLPPEIPTLPQLLREEGYHTAALVNNGQMKKHWGFGRGFDTWQEFDATKDEGNCTHITREALAWLKANQASPFFLFLHYYDTHLPYAAPERFRRQMETTLSGKDTETLCSRHNTPDRRLTDKALLADLIAAYDAEIAWLDHELGKLLDALPPDTLVVIFSDHGEAFGEHGWLLHGATLYEEETRVPLIVRLPEGQRRRPVVDDSTMLMDVAPTILARCGVRVPAAFQGTDLAPACDGKSLPPRLIPSETKSFFENRYSLSVVLHPLKGIYSLFDGRFELYKLPDEQRDLAATDRPAAEALLKPLREWMNGEQFWMIYAVGRGDFEATVELSEGQFGLSIPVRPDPERDSFERIADGRAVRWHVYPSGLKPPKALFLQAAHPGASLRFDCKINGAAARELVFLGKDGRHPDGLPATIPADLAPSSPFIEQPFSADKDGFYIVRYRTEGARPRPALVQPLDEQTIRQLRSLGYLQ
ncbi:MAG TPA: sulfatase [Gemmataceae bacterium]|nr:sulfatase [Gemmataceae bacterium]